MAEEKKSGKILILNGTDSYGGLFGISWPWVAAVGAGVYLLFIRRRK